MRRLRRKFRIGMVLSLGIREWRVFNDLDQFFYNLAGGFERLRGGLLHLMVLGVEGK